MQTTFQVYAAHDGRNHCHNIEGQSYEDAALAFVEEWRPAADADGEVQIIVREAAVRVAQRSLLFPLREKGRDI